MGGGGRKAARFAGRRDRFVGGRHAARRAPPAPRWLRPPSARILAEHRALRRARRAGLQHSVDLPERADPGRQRVQHQGQIAPAGRFLARGGRGLAGPAHAGNRPGVSPGCPGTGLGSDAGPAVAGERALRAGLLRERTRAGLEPCDRSCRHPGSSGATHSGTGRASGPVGRQAERTAGEARHRAVDQRFRETRFFRAEHAVCAGLGPDCSGRSASHRQSDLCGKSCLANLPQSPRQSSSRIRQGT